MQIKPFGDSAILIEFEQEIDQKINAKVNAYHQAILKAKIKGVMAFIPAYCSLTVSYNPLEIQHQELSQKILSLDFSKEELKETKRLFTIPVCYDEVFGLDLEWLVQEKSISKEEIIELHTSQVYQVFMLGFLPGFAYLGKLPEILNSPRKAKPRLKVPQGSVGLAGYQTGIYPSDSPGGWQIIGKTPIQVFNIKQENLFLFKQGEQVKFKTINLEEFYILEEKIQKGVFENQSLYE